MKSLKNFVLALGIVLTIPTTTIAQSNTFCATPASTTQQQLNVTLATESNNSFSTNYCLRIYIHVIRSTSGTGGVSLATINNAIGTLNEDFGPFNIKFIWDNNIDYIDNSTYIYNPNSSIFSVNNHTDGIDIYFYDEAAPGGGLASGVGSSTEFFISGRYWKPPYTILADSHAISHEMGHILFLWHTFHGTWLELGNDQNQCGELVNGSNGSICGDYVFDTPADPNIDFNINLNNCQWTHSGATDPNGDTYDPDEKNIMAYTHVDCMEYFTMEQGLRMRNAISSLPHLQNALVNNCCIGAELDLFMRDRPQDNGNDAGYTWTWNLDESPDIWVRNKPDGLTNHIHENPEYTANQPVYVYVRVGNKSCEASSGNEKLSLYWTLASSNSSWPKNWDGSSPSIGNKINTQNIPILQPGESTILEFSWTIDPNTGVGSTWNNCLLARIENSTIDDITVFPGDLASDIYFNNNVSLRNVIVQNYIDGALTAYDDRFSYIGNSSNSSEYYDFIFQNSPNTDHPITEVAEVTFELDQLGWNKLLPHLQQSPDIKLKPNNRFTIVGNSPVILSNIHIPANTSYKIKTTFNFLVDEVDSINTFKYHLSQKVTNGHPTLGDHWTGSLHFVINKGPRNLFDADAGNDQSIDIGDQVTITADQINEAAEYNWYDQTGNLVYTGTSLTVSPQITEEYLLEVVADSDGFKDYDLVSVTVNPYIINSLSPNPASSQVTICYDVSGANSAYLMIIGTTNYFTSNNYILDITQSQTTINLNSYVTGNYTVGLVVNGTIVDAKSLVIQ